MLYRSVIYVSISLFWPTQQVSPFLILSVVRAVRCFYNAYSYIVLTHTSGYEQTQEIQGQIPENCNDILRYIFAYIQIVNVLMYLYVIYTAL
jgi:hypothetical protein